MRLDTMKLELDTGTVPLPCWSPHADRWNCARPAAAPQAAPAKAAVAERRNDAHPHSSGSCLGSAADTSPIELAALCEHLGRCTRRRSTFAGWRRAGDAVDDLLRPRMMTMFALSTLLGVVVALLS